MSGKACVVGLLLSLADNKPALEFSSWLASECHIIADVGSEQIRTLQICL